MGRESPPWSVCIPVMVEFESLCMLKLSWLAQARWLNVFRAAFDSLRL
jgi:hypothetical protein